MTDDTAPKRQKPKTGFPYRPSDFRGHPLICIVEKDFNEYLRLEREYPDELRKLIKDWKKEIDPQREAEYWADQHKQYDLDCLIDYVPGETWEDFREQLLFWRKISCRPRDGSPFEENLWITDQVRSLQEKIVVKKGRFPKSIMEVAYDAWTTLQIAPPVREKRNAPATVVALDLLEDAGKEKILENREKQLGFSSYVEKKKDHKRKDGALQKARTQTMQTLYKAVSALQKYIGAARTVEESRPGADPVCIETLYPELMEEAYAASRALMNLSPQLQAIVEQIEQVKPPVTRVKGPGQRGRRQKNALNTAWGELKNLFLTHPDMSIRKAEEYTHSLLYIAGFCTQTNPHNMRSKFSQLQDHSAA